MVDADFLHTKAGCKHPVEKARELIDTYLYDYGADTSVLNDAHALLVALECHQTLDLDPVVRSRLSMILKHHLWQYWYYDGIPLSVRIVYWAAIEAGLMRVPKFFFSRWDDFCAHLQERKARETAIRHSDMAGGWLFPGEPQALWEFAKLAAEMPGDFCELGTWTGRSATILCAAVKHFAPDKKVLLVDNWKWGLEGERYPFMTEGRNILIELEQQLKPYAGTYLPFSGIVLDQRKAIKATLRSIRLALLHHDAGHDYEHVYRDLDAYLPLLAEGGYLIVHDYNHPQNPGVRKAVDDIVHSLAPNLYRVSIFNTFGLFRKGSDDGAGDGLAALGTDRTSPSSDEL